MQETEYKAVGSVLFEDLDVGSHDLHLLVAVVEVTGARSDHDMNWNLHLLFNHSQQPCSTNHAHTEQISSVYKYVLWK